MNRMLTTVASKVSATCNAGATRVPKASNAMSRPVRQGAVTDHRDRLPGLAFGLCGQRHPQGGSDGGARVPHAEGAVGALVAVGESR